MSEKSLSGESSSRRIALVFFLNLGFSLIEFIGGVLTNSTAIMADAVHDLGDALSIGSAWVLDRLGHQSADEDFTYGYRRLSLFGALLNGLILLGGSVWVLSAAIPRLLDPVMPVTEGMTALAILGLTVNGYAAWRISRGTSLNEKMLNWHLLEDVLGWATVLVVSLILHFVEWPILDPLLSIIFTLFILINVARNLRLTGKLFFQGVPDKALRDKICSQLRDIDDIQAVHHLHLWSLDGEHHVLTAHLVMDSGTSLERHQQIKEEIAELLEPYPLQHTTIEIEHCEELCRDGLSDTVERA